ncbi:MAG: nicotinate phosphoribosyltransferase [Candidatus Palauibacterales bacterium]|nr:nicotinate phosphoribosyltransferase [Candidatus Palauibacterales bacterium]
MAPSAVATRDASLPFRSRVAPWSAIDPEVSMDEPTPWVDDRSAALLTDLYELTMLQAYWREGMDRDAVFSLYYRRLPEPRNYVLAAGLEDALRYLETVSFPPEGLDFLAGRREFSREFVDWLADFEFTGDVRAMPEGTPVFPYEPLLEVTGPMPEAQLAETFIMNQVHFQSVLASKAARIVEAAGDRAVVDFGLRRMHGTDAGMKGARAYHIAGVAATSNVLAGRVYGVPITGTMAHSYVQSHDDELEAFRAFAEQYPETVLLVDTYDTLDGIRKVVELSDELGDDFRVRAVRLDSGDLAELAVESREILDRAGLEDVEIFASGGLDEYEIAEIVERDAPITGFGVGTRMGTARDAPSLDMAYKLTAYSGRGRLKLSSGKRILPGPKQVYRREEDGVYAGDVVARAGEEPPEGRPLLRTVMEDGERTEAGHTDLDEARERRRRELDRLPERIRRVEPADAPYPVQVSEELEEYEEDVRERVIAETGD